MEELYANYGKAAVALEIAQARFNEAKKALVEALNKLKETTSSWQEKERATKTIKKMKIELVCSSVIC